MSVGSASLNRNLLYESLIEYYQERPEQLQYIKDMNTKSNGMPSLRLIDYFVVNYSRDRNTFYIHHDRPFFVHANYKDQLKTYQKINFDPFRRGKKIIYNGVCTTISQMNFFRWAISRGVLSYIMKNMKAIESADAEATASKPSITAAAVFVFHEKVSVPPSKDASPIHDSCNGIDSGCMGSEIISAQDDVYI